MHLSVSNYLLSSTDKRRNPFGCKIEVPSKLNINRWRHYLADYPDKEICDFLQYGWPINYTSQTEPDRPIRNHSSACFYKQIIDNYVSLETTENATEGPYDPGTKLFVKPIHSVPLMTVPKKGSTDKRRVVLDFSYPEGRLVNDGIPKDTYLGETFHLRLPGSAQFIDIINSYGHGCLLLKADLKQAYTGRFLSTQKIIVFWHFYGVENCYSTPFFPLVFDQPAWHVSEQQTLLRIYILTNTVICA